MQAELKKAFVETTTKPYFSYLDQLMKEAGGKYFVGNKVETVIGQFFSLGRMLKK